MFLNVLNTEEKEKFLELIYKIASVDGDFSEDEEEIVNNYKIELEVFEIKDTGTIEELLSYFGTKDESIRKLVLFEVYGMICADGKIEQTEEKIFEYSKNVLGLTQEQIKDITEVASELQRVYDKIYDILS